MDLTRGLVLEAPGVVVPWAAEADDVRRVLGEVELRWPAPGYAVAAGVEGFGGWSFDLGIHLGGLGVERFELMDGPQEDRSSEESFPATRERLVAALGEPDWRGEPLSGYGVGECRDFVWEPSGALVIHRLMYRFGWEQHAWILRAGVEVPYGDPRLP